MFEKIKNRITEIIKRITKNNSKELENESGAKTKLKPVTITNLIILFLVGVLLVIVGSIFTKNEKAMVNSNSQNENIIEEANSKYTSKDKLVGSAVDLAYKEKMENELISILENIQGVGKVNVMIYFESGQEQIPVFNQNNSNSNTKEKDTSGGQRETTQENGGTTVVMENNGEKEQPFIVKTYNPKIAGICIVAEGAGERVTELRVRQAVTKLFGISDDKVQVYPMKK